MAPFLGFVVSLPEFHRITHLNAVREFHDHPFSVIPKDQASAGALEAKAAGRDVSVVSKGKPAERMRSATDLGSRAERNEPG